MRLRYWVSLGCSLLLALVFLSSGIGKVLGKTGFLLNLLNLAFLPRVVVNFIGNWLPWGELGLGILLLTGIFIQPAALLSAVLSCAFIFHNIWMISTGYGYKPCGCLGIFEKVFRGELSSWSALYVDIAMLVLAVVVYFSSSGRFLDWRPWPMRRVRAEAIPAATTSPDSTPNTPSPNSGG